jgi:hypothetical protein
MSDTKKRTRLETEAIVIGYAMSRLDRAYLMARGYSTWQAAYAEAAKSLAKPPETFNNLRDEFDPIHPNARKGWHDRIMRDSRQKVLNELKDVSDDALLELVTHILQRDEENIGEAIDSLAVVNHVAHNVAERLLTGRRAEEYFWANSQHLIEVAAANIIDRRGDACGYDFGIQEQPHRAIEVKGLKANRGMIQFTDREWTEAKARRSDYWLVIIGNLATQPTPKIFCDPYHSLTIQSRYRQTVAIEWTAIIAI